MSPQLTHMTFVLPQTFPSTKGNALKLIRLGFQRLGLEAFRLTWFEGLGSKSRLLRSGGPSNLKS